MAAARQVLGSIDLDPASCATANLVVKARTFYKKDDDGLVHPWKGNVFLNPPGGRTANRSNQLLWWKKLVGEWRNHSVRAAIFVGFNLELLRTTQSERDSETFAAVEFPFVIPRNRIPFLAEVDGKLVPQTSPTHANVIVYLPEHGSADECIAFKDAFSKLGAVIFPPFERWRATAADPSP